MRHTDMAMLKLYEAIGNKLAAEGLTLQSPRDAIEACLAQVVSPTACIKAAREMYEHQAQ